MEPYLWAYQQDSEGSRIHHHDERCVDCGHVKLCQAAVL